MVHLDFLILVEIKIKKSIVKPALLHVFSACQY